MRLRKSVWHILIFVGLVTVASELRSYTGPVPVLKLPAAAAEWKLDSQACFKPKQQGFSSSPGIRGWRQACIAEYSGPGEIKLTVYDMPGWPAGSAFGAFQGWRPRADVMAFYKGGIFGTVESAGADAKALDRFAIAIQSTLPRGTEGRWLPQ